MSIQLFLLLQVAVIEVFAVEGHKLAGKSIRLIAFLIPF
jgi:hypothetical protein